MSEKKPKRKFIQYCLICGKRLNYLGRDKNNLPKRIFPRYQIRKIEEHNYNYNGKIIGYLCPKCVKIKIIKKLEIKENE